MAAAVLVAGALTLGIIRATRSNRARAPGAFEYTQLTNFTDAAFLPTLSPDGRMLAFIRGIPGTVGGKGDIFVKLLPDGEAVQLTHDGYEPLLTSGNAKAPLWDSIPADLVSELWPAEAHSDIRWHYQMQARADDRPALIDRASELRERLLAETPPPAGAAATQPQASTAPASQPQ